jgi:hypothetical protein
MITCNTCGNTYDRGMTILMNGSQYEFDCFECAIAALAPRCGRCSCTVIGHGVQADEVVYCCAHCARLDQTATIIDRV